MKIGIFDSGLGGLLITHSLTQNLPDYDYLYLGDTARVPYGNRSQATIYEFTKQAVEYLIAHDCQLIIIACNTASAEALHRLQVEFLPYHPHVTILGVLIPAAEAAVDTGAHEVGVLATAGTVKSAAFDREIHKLKPSVKITSQAAPLLVPLIENNGLKWSAPILAEYLEPFAAIHTVILGCTHYPYMKEQIRAALPHATIISQDEVVPAKLKIYLNKHTGLAKRLSRNGSRTFRVTDLTDQAVRLAAQLYGQDISLELVSL